MNVKIKKVFLLYSYDGWLQGFALSKQEAIERGYSYPVRETEWDDYYKEVQR